MRTHLIAIGAGLLVGIGVMVSMGAALGWSEPVQVVVTPSTSSVPGADDGSAIYVAANEAIIGQAALVPGSIEMDGDLAVFSYELETIAPLAGIETGFVALTAGDPGTPIDPLSLPPVFPDTWTLRTPGGDYPGETATLSSRSARFEVPSSFSPSQVSGLRLESYRVPVPVNAAFAMSADDPTFVAAPGVTISLIDVVDQGNQTIVQVEILSADPFNRENLSVDGVGPQWASAVREAEGRPRYNLRWAAENFPEPFTLRVRGIVWVSLDDPVDIVVGDS